MSSEIFIRPMDGAELERLVEITVAAFVGVSIDERIDQNFGPLLERDWRWRKAQAVRLDWEREPAGVFVAVLEDQVVGGITTWHDLEAGVGFIPNLAIDAAFRGLGIGRKLLEYAKEHFRQLGLSVVRIETLAHNDVGNHLYRSVGFEEVARQIHFALPLQRVTVSTEGGTEASSVGMAGDSGIVSAEQIREDAAGGAGNE